VDNSKYEALEAKYETEHAQAEKDREEHDNAWGKMDIRKQRAFKQAHDQKINQSLGWAANVLIKRGGVEVEDAKNVVAQAFSIQDYAKRSAFLMDQAPEVATLLDNELMKADDLRDKRLSAIENWRGTQTQLAETEARMEEVSTRKQREAIHTAVMAEMREAGNYYYLPVGGNSPAAKEWNDGILDRDLAVDQIMLNQDQKEIHRYVAEGVTARAIRRDRMVLKEENAKLKKDIEGMKALKPRVNPGRPLANAPAGDAPAEGERMTVRERTTLIARGQI